MNTLLQYSGNIKGSKNHLVQKRITLCGSKLHEPIVTAGFYDNEGMIRHALQNDCRTCFKKVNRESLI